MFVVEMWMPVDMIAFEPVEVNMRQSRNEAKYECTNTKQHV